MNKAIFIGNLTRDAESKTSNAGKPYAQFSMAVNSKEGEKESTLYVTCFHLGKFERILPYLKKGTKVMAEGRLSASAYTDKNGQPHPSISIIVSSIELLSRSEENASTPAKTDAISSSTMPFTPSPQPSSNELPF